MARTPADAPPDQDSSLSPSQHGCIEERPTFSPSTSTRTHVGAVTVVVGAMSKELRQEWSVRSVYAFSDTLAISWQRWDSVFSTPRSSRDGVAPCNPVSAGRAAAGANQSGGPVVVRRRRSPGLPTPITSQCWGAKGRINRRNGHQMVMGGSLCEKKEPRRQNRSSLFRKNLSFGRGGEIRTPDL